MAASEIGKLTEAVPCCSRRWRRWGWTNGAAARAVTSTRDPTPGTSDRRLVAARVLLSLAFSQHELGRRATAEQTLDDAGRLAATSASRPTAGS